MSCVDPGGTGICEEDPTPPACAGAECEPSPTMLAPTCDDGERNGSESGVDCGPGCPNLCSAGASCNEASDCTSKNCVNGRCLAASCDDDVLNQDETDTDCGGSCPNGCGPNQGCLVSGDCSGALFCPPGTSRCTDPSCTDGETNGDEILEDCGGGTCPGCPVGTACNADGDCASGNCGNNGLCAAPNCNDGVRNQNEFGPDCGGVCVPGCGTGTPCAITSDCTSGVCGTQNCGPGIALCCQAPSCNDGRRNGNEANTDCGGSCPRCADLSPCNAAADCASNNCFEGQCISCGDSTTNGFETDIDCGGSDPFCQRCLEGRACLIDGDCASGACVGGRCCGGTLGDCTRCAERLSPNADCSDVAAQGAEANCTAFLNCLAANPTVCTRRFAPGCTQNPGDVCYHNNFGGDGTVALQHAGNVLNDARCQQ